ncbi:transcription initiation factor TFIIB [Marchantia polymorpha subsp. ruderalis]|uniref:TFIIB-type domain-containing protein n=2 Tax=Marchantia polymorpha TaxID=3197 RepID=A0AAF6BMM2_MARPO|nr:hypothetical protein MARPO_0052s0001 [Marchantia polymorpha]BBN13256.1 hypothetical protein Mp_6g02040 [Marchantia polymorpha subsp. ruderalis]|eukprot:PTQ38190.1 hypothetical protein MARPO_0052s0001 [Marchantia polymorpha]
MNVIVCPDCKTREHVMDYASGDVICVECGLVLESHFVDDAPEWRTFADQSGAKDRNRVGDSYNALLPDGGISTTFSHVEGNCISSSLKRAESRLPNGDSSRLLSSITRCASMASRLGLVRSIQTIASEIYQKVTNLNLTRGKSQEAVLASCLYLACRQEGEPRSMKEICSVAEGTSLKEVGRALLYIEKHIIKEKHIKEDLGMGKSVNARDFVIRFCIKLGVSYKARLAATKIVQMADNRLYVRRNPMSVAATAIFMVSQIHEPRKSSMGEISTVCGVGIITILETYEVLLPRASMIIPAWFANHEQLRALPPLPLKRRALGWKS